MGKTWWEEYRKNKYKVRKHMNLEKIARKSFRENLSEVMHNLSLAGVHRLVDETISIPLRIFLGLVYSGVLAFFGVYLYYVWSGLSRPLIVTMESSTYPISEIDFPAVAICNVNKMSKRSVDTFTERLMDALSSKLYFVNENGTVERELTKNHYVKVFTEMGRLLDLEYSEAIDDDPFTQFGNTVDFDTHNIIKLMLEFAPKCSEMLIKCAWQGRIINCTEYFDVRRTILGHCCTFNYNRLYAEDGKPTSNIIARRHQQNPGILNGLNLILDPQIDDYGYPIRHVNGYDILLFDALQYADFTAGGSVALRFLEVEQYSMIQLQSKVQYATDEVRKYSEETRKCLFRNERYDEFGDNYSYSACLTNCRIQAIQSLCKCTPYYYPVQDEDGPVCTLSDLRCLNKYREKLLYLYPQYPETDIGLEKEFQLGVSCPKCYPDCEDIVHYARASKTQINTAAQETMFQSLFVTGVNLTNKCLLSIYQTTSDGVLNRLDVVAYWYELLSSVGGFGGMLIGFSIISALELVYFATIRYLLAIYSNFLKFY